MIDIRTFTIKESLFESDSFSIYRVIEKNNPNMLISKVIKQPIVDKESIIQQLEFFLTIHHPSFLPLAGFSLIDFHNNPYLTIICDDLSCITYQEYRESPQFTEESKNKIYLACLSLFNYFKIRHYSLLTQNFSLNEFLFGRNNNFFPFVTFLSFEASKNIEEIDESFLARIKKELNLNEIKENDYFEFKKSMFLLLNEEEQKELQSSIDGDIEKCHEIGQFLLNGHQNFPQNYNEGIHFLKVAADKGNTDSQVILTSLFKNDPNMQSEAVHYCMMAAKSGHFGAICNLGFFLLEGKIITQNSEEAVKCFKIAAKNGVLKGIMNYAYCLSCGIGTNKNLKKSLKYYKIAANSGVIEAMLKIAEISDDKTERIEYSQKAADLGCSDGYNRLGDLTKNEEFYKKAADLGDFKAATKYAYYKSTKGETEEALKYFELAAENKDSTAIYNYSLLLNQTNQMNKEKMEKIVNFYLNAIHDGDVQSMLNLAEIYEDGDDYVEQDLNKVADLFKLASDFGNSEGSLNYGRILENEKNDVFGAIKFYQKAAENGNNDALVYLARSLNKIGGDPDIILQLINKSIELGNPEGMFMLGMMYADGKFVEKNKEEAKKLLIMADENGFETESPSIQEIIESL